MNGPRKARLPRQLRCDSKFGSIVNTFGRLDTNADGAPAAQVVGIAPSFVMYDVKSGTGTAEPTQTNWPSASGNPVFVIAGATRPGRKSLRNSPMPPLRNPHGAPKFGMPVVPLCPKPHPKLARGLTTNSRGA